MYFVPNQYNYFTPKNKNYPITTYYFINLNEIIILPLYKMPNNQLNYEKYNSLNNSNLNQSNLNQLNKYKLVNHTEQII